MTDICARCKEGPAAIWVMHQGQWRKVCGFCEIDIAISGW